MLTIYSKKIIAWLVRHSDTFQDPEQLEIYAYGLECFLNTTITIFVLFVGSILTHSILETFCWIISFSIFRHHAGGWHAPTQLSCILSSSLLGISNMLIIRHFELRIWHIITILLGSLIICLLFAPIDSTKVILSKTEQKKEKIISIFILMFGAFAYFLLPTNFSSSIIHAFLCTDILIVAKKISDNLK